MLIDNTMFHCSLQMMILHLLDIEKSKDALYGIALEIEDLASHVVLGS